MLISNNNHNIHHHLGTGGNHSGARHERGVIKTGLDGNFDINYCHSPPLLPGVVQYAVLQCVLQ